MGLGNLGLYRPDGRLRGTFVYVLLCRDAGPVYAKVGISDRPSRRLQTLRQGCPVSPRQFCWFEVRSRRKARTIEAQLHGALRSWAAHGEWFRVPVEHKPQFNACLRTVIDVHREPAWPCTWEKVSVSAVAADDQRRMAANRAIVSRGSFAQIDAIKHWRESRARDTFGA